MSDAEKIENPELVEPISDIDLVPHAIESPPSNSLRMTRIWWVTGICLVTAILLFGWSWFSRGLQIHVRFRDGHGLRAENRLMHRGIEVGIVERVQLDRDLENVDVVIRLNESARSLACEGSRFWIERPIASIQGVRSLETILSGRYVAVEPGSNSNHREIRFQGLDQPPQPSIAQGALEIILEANERHGLQINAPVIYRGLEVGRIQSVGLSADSRWVQIRAVVDEDYRTLVRENSRFWNRSGFRFDVGLSGVEIDAESLSSIAIGGIEFATPDPPAAPVKTGRRFELASRADDSWTQWRPRILYGTILPKELDIALSPIRLSQHWQERLFGFRKNQSRSGWILPLSDGTAIGPSHLFEMPSSAIENTTRWEAAGVEVKSEQMKRVDGRSQAMTKKSSRSLPGVSRYGIENFTAESPRWPVERLAASLDEKPPSGRLWVACDVPSRWIPIEPHQLTATKDEGWLIDPSLGIAADQHGVPVLDGEVGKVIGFVIVDQRTAKIVGATMP